MHYLSYLWFMSYPYLLTADDEEREQLAKEISKDWSSGDMFFFKVFAQNLF